MTRKSASTKLPARPEANAAPELLLECPPELSPAAKKEWDRLLLELPRAVKLKNLDRTVLAVHCESIAMWQDAIANIQKYGAVMKSPNGYPVQSPYVAIANQQVAQIIKTATELGLSPASRTRVPQVRSEASFSGGLPDLNWKSP